ncbi:MAG: glycosyltransferase family A protein [Opitutae bacterium]|nr:glycosyltransferase family A protein [Opitutae bacterium]
MRPLVSILIPCYNAARWLAATLESALAQTWPHTEIIVVDDGSSDNSLMIARSFTSRGVHVLTQPNRGAAAARNAALAAAQGELIQFLDADDLLAPGKIAAQVEALTTAPAGSIASGPWGRFTLDPSSASFHPEPVWTDLTPLDWLVLSWSGGGMFPPLVWLTPRRIIDAAGPWNEDLSLDDDGEYFCRVLLQAATIRFVPGADSYYRDHSGPRVSASQGDRAARSSFLSIELKDRHALVREESPRMRRALASNYQRFAWEQLVDAPALATLALARMQAHSPDLPPPDGPRLYRWVSRVLGWPRARRLQLIARRAPRKL